MSSQTPAVASTQAGPDCTEALDGATITPVGVDVGTRQLFVATTLADGVDGALAEPGAYVQALHSEFVAATQRINQPAGDAIDDTTLGQLVARYWPKLRAAFVQAADRVLEYARQQPAPVLVCEDLAQQHQPLVACRHGRVRTGTWVPPVARAILVERAVDAGIPVATVDPTYTSQECHICGEQGDLGGDDLVCTTDGCPVDAVDRDRSAAVTIAKRYVDST